MIKVIVIVGIEFLGLQKPFETCVVCYICMYYFIGCILETEQFVKPSSNPKRFKELPKSFGYRSKKDRPSADFLKSPMYLRDLQLREGAALFAI